MHIKFVDVQNYRKLKSTRIEFTDKTTLFVGANNSGKTTAMDALIKFLDKNNQFTINDFTLSNWIELNSLGESWLEEGGSTPSIDELGELLPTMDIWLHVEEKEIHYVTHLIPSLDWDGGLLGVRLRLEPRSINDLYKDFIEKTNSMKDTLSAIKSEGKKISFSLWPRDFRDYVNKKIQTVFTIKAYLLDPTKCLAQEGESAKPQKLPLDSDSIDGDPFKRLFLVHHISAQRGFTDTINEVKEEGESKSRLVGNLSSQLRKYYNTHLNPTKSPELNDIEALQAIELAQGTFNEKLHMGFKKALNELENLGYPGFSNPKISISTKIEPMDGLNHDSAVQFDLLDGNNDLQLKLPEQYNGLGYQNLISMIFKLMRFRDEWMRVGKIAKKTTSDHDDFLIPPLHIVLVEEPEAHLHIQVQQVFIRHAYKVLCNHENINEQNSFTTQLIVSTHSGHIAHEMPFSCLRYFRRIPSSNIVPTSTVVNLSNVFGKEDETERFVTRYLKSTHCDLFFADAAILVEGPAERMLIPHFVRHQYPKLNQMYISLLEIGGSHAHKLRPLIEFLGLTSLIITDLDSANPSKNYSATPPSRNMNYVTGNDTLKYWVPSKVMIDDLLDLEPRNKVYTGDDFSVRVAYQYPVKVSVAPEKKKVEAIPYTFEDALVFENLTLFKSLEGNGLIRKFRDAINKKKTIKGLGKQLFEDLRKSKKAEFALELIFSLEPNELNVPTYIKEGLSWLEEQLQQKDNGIIERAKESEVKEMERV